MSEKIALNIDVSKIDRSLFYKGAKGDKLDAILVPTPNDQYGNDFFIAQSLPKERREAGEKGPIIGNAKILRGQGQRNQPQQQRGGQAGYRPQQQQAPAKTLQQGYDDQDPIPF